MNNKDQHDTEASTYSTEAFSNVLQDSNDTLNQLEEIPPIPVLIKQERKKRGLSQKDLSVRADITNVQLSRIERGECNPAVRTLTKLAPFLGYPLETLLTASHYQGVLPSATPTYVDLDGQVINLEEVAHFMYRTDGELFLLIWNFYKQYSILDSEILKILLNGMAECQNIINQGKNTHQKHLFAEAFSNLKQFILSFWKMSHATINN